MLLNYDSAVIITPGRTGSQLIRKNFQDFFNIRITHTHNPLWSPPANCIAFISKRRNMLESIASTLVGKRSNEFTSYTYKILESFTVDRTEFESCFWFYRCYYYIIDTTKFSKIIEVWHEDMLEDPKYLYGLLGIDKLTDYTFPKSPYDYYQLISNIDQCRGWFDCLVKQPITQDLIDSFKSSITADLEEK
jgi:hypothetical protein